LLTPSFHLPHLPSFPTRRSSDLQGGEDVVPIDLLDEPVERLLVGQHRGGDDRERDGELAVAERRHGAEQADRDGRALRGNPERVDRKSTRLNSSHGSISYAVFYL